jgi:hypothetical protein
MLDFTELPQDGTAFEQLVREMFLGYGMHVEWTGKGPDQGRDLVVVEALTGPLGVADRRWLVQCKHFAKSQRAVGRDDVGTVIDDCGAIGAAGYLLACSTVASSGLTTKLSELSARTENGIITKVWDGVEIERRLADPRLFAIAQLFFPKSLARTPWRLYNAGMPNRWTANYKATFVVLVSRVSGEPPPLNWCAAIIERLLAMRLAKDEQVRPRAIYYDDAYTNLYVFADYLIVREKEPALSPADFAHTLGDGFPFTSESGEEVPHCNWGLRVRAYNPFSDHYHRDHPDYYKPYEKGPTPGDLTPVGELAEYHGNRWR